MFFFRVLSLSVMWMRWRVYGFATAACGPQGRSASFSNPLARGIMGILLMNDRKIGEEKEEERK